MKYGDISDDVSDDHSGDHTVVAMALWSEQ